MDVASIALALAVALLLGLRHATDPDHLTAVATLIAADDAGQAVEEERGTDGRDEERQAGSVTPS